MKKVIFAALVLIFFASCGLCHKETHTFIHRERLAGTLMVSTKVITSTASYYPGQMIDIDGKIWICQN